jgi:hypothetical protein
VKHIVLDSNVILKEPAVLFRGTERVKLYVPTAVFFELGRLNKPATRVGDFRSLVAEAANKHLVTILPEIVGGEYPGTTTLSNTDVSFLLSAYELKRALADEVYVASDDKHIWVGSQEMGLLTLTSTQLKALLDTEGPDISDELFDKADKFKRENVRYVVINIIISVIAASIVNVTSGNLPQIYDFITKWGLLALIPVLGVGLYYMRSKFRLSYGLSEIFVGTYAAGRVVFPVSRIHTFEDVVLIQFLGGLYVMVRGMDNIEKGLKGTRFLSYWQSIFGEG